MSTKAERKERTHETILESAARLIRAKGIAGTRVAEVMSGAGLTVGGFYAHFATKKDLVDDAVRRTGASMRDQLFAKLEGVAPERRIEVLLRRYLSAAHRDEKSLGCPFPAIAGEVATTAPEHGEVLGEQIEEMAKQLSTSLPSNDAGIPKRHVALALVSLMIGGLTIARAVKGTSLSDDVLRACASLGAKWTKMASSR